MNPAGARTAAGSPISAADADLLTRAALWDAAPSDFRSLTNARLGEIARTEGLDFATALVYDRTLRAAANATFVSQVAATDSAAVELPELIAVVPGAFHREHRDTGADGARVVQIAHELGCAAELIPVKSFGRIDDHARIITAWLTSRPERRIMLISLSKGSADVKRALAGSEAGRAFAHVTAWISFSGIVQGTPLIAWLRARPLRWWGVHLLLWLRFQRGRTLDDLSHGPGAPLADWPALPAHLRMVHIYGVPLRHHLAHPWAPRAYDRLALIGPNDGGSVVLGDLAGLPGIVFPLWGTDHYLQPSWDMTPLLRKVVLAALREDFPHASQSAKIPTNAPAARSSA